MTDRTIRLLGSEGNLSSASNVGLSKLVRVLNNKGSVQVIMILLIFQFYHS